MILIDTLLIKYDMYIYWFEFFAFLNRVMYWNSCKNYEEAHPMQNILSKVAESKLRYPLLLIKAVEAVIKCLLNYWKLRKLW